MSSQAPGAKPDFGRDLWNDGDIDPSGREVEGTDPLALAQALLRRLDTEAGTLPDDRGEDEDDEEIYGWNLENLASEGMTDDELAAAGHHVRQQFELDERVRRADVVAKLFNREEVILECRIFPRNGGPFKLVAGVSDAAKRILLVSPEGGE